MPPIVHLISPAGPASLQLKAAHVVVILALRMLKKRLQLRRDTGVFGRDYSSATQPMPQTDTKLGAVMFYARTHPVYKLLFILLLLLSNAIITAQAAANFRWPEGKIAAVSLAYDDALPSQLDIALPQLNHAGLKASFYLPLSALTLTTRLADWRAVAAAGHELGNHSLFHQCSRIKPGRDWVSPQHDLYPYSLKMRGCWPPSLTKVT